MIKDIEATWLIFQLLNPDMAEYILHDVQPHLPAAPRSKIGAALEKIGVSTLDYCKLAEYAQRQRGRK